MSPKGRPEGERAPERVSAKGKPTTPKGRPEGEQAPKRVSAKGEPMGAAAAARVSGAAHAPAARIAGLDALRGIAIVAMAIYHFCFDLRYFGVLRADFEHDPFWLVARGAILSSFLLIAGISMVLAREGVRRDARWLRHAAVIAGAALLVSAASYVMFPRSYIWFGVLHAIAVSLVVARPFVDRPLAAVAAGAVVIAAGIVLSHTAFDNRALGWIGFMTHKPVTEDYVPLFPWTGVLLLGIGAGHWLARERFESLAPLDRVPAAISFLGRHSLVVYLVHQPLLIALLWLGLHTA